MSKLGRPANQVPATAYEYRRQIELVQIMGSNLSSYERWTAYQQLASDWGVTIPDKSLVILTNDQLANLLARFLTQQT